MIVEETLQLCFKEGDFEARNQLIQASGGVDLAVEYAETTKEIAVVFSADKKVQTILNQVEESDGISMILLEGMTSQIDETEKEGKVVLRMVMK